MASALMRRSAFTALLAAAATIVSPLAGTAFAATALTAPTFSTSPADSSGTVKANQPTFTATYNTAIAGSSTISLIDTSASNAAVACPGSVSGSAISCKPSSSLTDGHVYTVSVHAVNAADSSNTNNATKNYTIDIPSVVAGTVKPTPGSTVGDGSTKIQATFDEAIDTNTANSFVTVTNVNHNQVPGSTTFTKSGSPNPLAVTDTIVFSPAVPDGTYQVHIHVSGSGNTAAFADVNFSYSVNGTLPPAGPNVTTAGYSPDGGATHWINSSNQSAVPFGGTAPDGFQVGVVVYDKGAQFPNCHIGTCPNDRSTTISVPDCGADFCPWSGTINLSGTPSNADYQYWVYSFSAAGKKPAAANTSTDPVITKDTTAPGAPSFTADAPVLTGSDTTSSAPGQAKMHVSATDADPNTYSYIVTATDATGKTDTDTFGIGTGASHPGAKDMLVGDLEDGNSNSTPAGPLTVDVLAVDKAGNVSADPGGLNASSVDKDTRTLTPDYADSYVTVNGTNIKFPQLAGKTINTPTSVTVLFNELLRASDKSSNTTYFTSGLCFADNTHLCLGGSTAITGGGKALTFTLSNPSGINDGGSPYRIEDIIAVAGSVDDSGDASGEHYKSVDDLGGHGTVVSFNLDNVAPAVAVTAINGHTPGGGVSIDATNIKSTVISGTVDNDATSMSLTLKPSTGTPIAVQSDSITITHPATGPATWTTSPLDLSAGVADGPLQITGSAVDAAANHGTSPTSSTLVQARPSVPQNLSNAAGNGRLLLAWAAPATTGGSPLTGYTLTVTDILTPGSPMTFNPASTATSYEVDNLSNGHTYSVSLRAGNAIGNGPAATTSATPRGTTSLTTIAPKATTYGSSVSVHGILSYAGVGLGSKPITMTSTYAGGKHGPTWHVVTDSFGNWHVSGIKAPKNITFVASFAGDSAYQPASSSARMLVRVAIRITKVSARSSSHLSTVTIRGTVAPNMHGRTVYIYERVGKHNIRLGHVRLTSKSTFSYSRKFARGKHVVFAKFNSQNGNAGNSSRTVKFSRT